MSPMAPPLPPRSTADGTSPGLSAHDVFSLPSLSVALLLDDAAGQNRTLNIEDGQAILVHLLVGVHSNHVPTGANLLAELPEHSFEHRPDMLTSSGAGAKQGTSRQRALTLRA